MDRRLYRAVLALMLVAVWSGTARATDDVTKGAARDLANEAKRDFDAGNYVEAARKFQRAFEVTKVPMLAVWSARTLVKRGQLVAASELYRQAMLLAPNDLWVGNAQQQAQRITFRGTTGDTSALLALLTGRYGFARRVLNDPSVMLYEAVDSGNQSIGSVNIHSAPVIQANQPYRRFEVELVMDRNE